MVDVTPVLPSTGNFKVIRIVRVVRPLAKRSPVVKNLLAAFGSSFGNIGHVINLFAILILIVGLLGVQLFKARPGAGARGARARGWGPTGHERLWCGCEGRLGARQQRTAHKVGRPGA